MKLKDILTFSLDNFEGPLPLLLHLIQKAEIDVYEVPIFSLGRQFLELLEASRANLDQGAEFIAASSFLLCLKSRALLPKSQRPPEEEWQDPHFDVIHHLLDYCRFKGAAKELMEIEKKQNGLHKRGLEPKLENRKYLGIEHLTLDDLADLFRQMAAKMPKALGKIEEENWKVGDKINLLKNLIKAQLKISFSELFHVSSRMELIVTFLALLELMKAGTLVVIKENHQANHESIWVCTAENIKDA